MLLGGCRKGLHQRDLLSFFPVGFASALLLFLLLPHTHGRSKAKRVNTRPPPRFLALGSRRRREPIFSFSSRVSAPFLAAA